MVYQRLADYKEFMTPIFSTKKYKSKKKSAQFQINKNLKKFFPKNKRSPEAVEIIKSQLAIREKI